MKRWQRLIALFVVFSSAPFLLMWIVGGQQYVYRARITIDVPAQDVFPHMVDPERRVEWIDGIDRIEPDSNDGHRVGALATIVIKHEDQTYELIDEVTVSEPNSVVEFATTGEGFDGVNRFDLKSIEGGTHIEQTVTARYSGALRTIAPLMTPAAENQMSADLIRLKRILENNAESPAPE